MGILKKARTSPGASTTNQKNADNSNKKNKSAVIYPMMPRGYTAVQRAALRKFERDLYAGRTVTVE